MQHIQKLNKNAIKMHNKPCAVEVDGKGKQNGVCYRKGEGGGKVEQATLTLGIIKAIFCVCDTKQKRKC